MSRLESFIRRMTAQRDILNHIAADLNVPNTGNILEIGLGNGRSFSHLQQIFPKRRIIAFDRAMAAHSSSVPEPENLILGEIEQTAQSFIGQNAALVHADIGTGYDEKDAVTLAWLPDLVATLLATSGIALCGLPLQHPHLAQLPLPDGINPDRYFLYRKIG